MRFLSGDRLKLYLLGIVMLYPGVDYLLRDLLHIPVLSGLWDEVVLGLLLILAVKQIVLHKPDRASKISVGIGILMISGLALTVLNLNDFWISVEGYRATFQYMLFFFAGFYLIRDNKEVKLLLTLSISLGTMLALHGIYQYLTNQPMPAGWVEPGEAVRTRAFSIIYSPNALGSHMALLAPITMGLSASEPNRYHKIFFLLCGILMGTCLIVTFTRGAWLAFAGAVAVVAAIYDRRLIFLGVIAVVAIAVFVPEVTSRFTYLFSAEYLEKSAGSGRIKRWFDAYDKMRAEPLFGAGLGHFGGAAAHRAFGTPSVDNYYLKTAAETGLVGLTLFLGLILTALKQGYQAWCALKQSDLRYVAAGIFTGLLAVVLHNCVENIFEVPYLNTYFWFILGLLLSLPFNKDS